MLIELQVKNFAIIDRVKILFRPGLNILSGETGAGKSVLLNSLGLLMGSKAQVGTVRAGENSATIEGCFDISKRKDIRQRLTAMGVDTEDGLLVVKRIISAHEKSRVYLNGSLSTLTHLRSIVQPLIEVTGPSAPLIEMTGQHDTRHLLSMAYHLDLIDHFAQTLELRKETRELHQLRRRLCEEMEKIETDSRERAQRLDFLVYQRDEIKELELKEGEEGPLEQSVQRLRNASRLSDYTRGAEDVLYAQDDSVLSRLHGLLQRSSELEQIDPQLKDMLTPLVSAKTQIEEVIYDLRSYNRSVENSGQDLNSLEERLSALRRLQKKHGPTSRDILAALEQMNDEIHTLEQSDERLEALKREECSVALSLKEKAERLHDKRSKAAKTMAAQVNEELKSLNMKGLEFFIRVDKLSHCSPTGLSAIEFMTKTSAKDQWRPLAKFASGGELSRILLSIKHIAGRADTPRTYLFDEVDAGVSGPTAEKVGKKLKKNQSGTASDLHHSPPSSGLLCRHSLLH